MPAARTGARAAGGCARRPTAPAPAPARPAKGSAAGGGSRRAVKLSNKDQRELSTLPERLQGLEAEKQRIEAELADATLYAGKPDTLHIRLERLAVITSELESGYARWAELESLSVASP